MGRRSTTGFGRILEAFAVRATAWSGRSEAFLLAVSVVVIWIVTGPVFHYSDTWQLVINTGTTVVTFLMVFLLQRAQNKDAMATQLKLNEIVAALDGASNRLILVERLSEADLQVLRKHYEKLAAMAAKDETLTKSHSVEEAESRHQAKLTSRTGKSRRPQKA